MILVISNSGGSFTIVNQPERLHKTEEELREMGVLLESVPVPDEIPGKDAVLKFDGTNLYYEYVAIPPSETEQLRNDLDNAILELSMAIAMQGGGN